MLTAALFSVLVALAHAAPHEGSAKPVSLPMRRHTPEAPLRKRALLEDGDWRGGAYLAPDKQQNLYQVYIRLGTPYQEIPATVDTGSTALVVMSKDCQGESDRCTLEPKFDADASSTYREIPNAPPFEITYADESHYEGIWSTDKLSIGGLWATKYGFALITNTTVEAESKSLIGLGWRQSDDQGPSIVERFAGKEGFLPHPVFSMYLNRLQGDEDEDNLPLEGLLTIGGADTDVYEGDITFFELFGEGNEWATTVDTIKLGNFSLPFSNPQKAHVDSGTSALWGPEKAVARLHQEIPGAVLVDGFWHVPCNTTNFNMTVSFGDLEVPLYWGDLMEGLGEDHDPSSDMCLSTLFPGDEPDSWMFGDVFMRNIYSVFSFDPPSIGFAYLKDSSNLKPETLLWHPTIETVGGVNRTTIANIGDSVENSAEIEVGAGPSPNATDSGDQNSDAADTKNVKVWGTTPSPTAKGADKGSASAATTSNAGHKVVLSVATVFTVAAAAVAMAI